MGINFPCLESASFTPVISRFGQFIYHDNPDSRDEADAYNPKLNLNPPSDIPVKALAYGGLFVGAVASFFKLKSDKMYTSILEQLKDWSFPIASLGVSALSFVLDYFSVEQPKELNQRKNC